MSEMSPDSVFLFFGVIVTAVWLFIIAAIYWNRRGIRRAIYKFVMKGGEEQDKNKHETR